MGFDREFDDIVRGYGGRVRLSTDSIPRPSAAQPGGPERALPPRRHTDADDGYVADLFEPAIDPAAVDAVAMPRFVAVAPGRPAAEAGAAAAAARPERLGIGGSTLHEFGPLASLVRDPDVTDVFANGAEGVFVDRGGGARLESGVRLEEPELRALATALLAAGGRHVDEANPCVDVRLHDGIRVHAVLPPISPRGTLLSIRLPRVERLALDDLEADGVVSGPTRARLEQLIARRANLLVTGAGGSGKTTLLGALLSTAAPDERIVVLEDVAELRIDHPHVVSLEARQPNIEGAGAVPLERLVREALRMRPDRLVLGECRGAEVRDLLAALNTGHDGGAGTLHANSLADVPARLEALGALAAMSPDALARQAVSAIGAVVHVERVGGRRRVTAIGRLALDERDRLAVVADP